MMIGADRNVNSLDYANPALTDDLSLAIGAKQVPEKCIAELTNHYVGELQSLQDMNSITVIFEEKGFSTITSNLLSAHNVACIRGKRYLTSNLEIFLKAEIVHEKVKVIGRLVPGFIYKDIIPIDTAKKQKTLLGPNEQSTSYTMLSEISASLIMRQRLYIYAKIVDILFIKFEYVCSNCANGTLLSLTKCINFCATPRPTLKLFMRCAVQDSAGDEAVVSLREPECRRLFSIDSIGDGADTFKEYFFQFGVFYFRKAKISCSSAGAQEYRNVLNIFKEGN